MIYDVADEIKKYFDDIRLTMVYDLAGLKPGKITIDCDALRDCVSVKLTDLGYFSFSIFPGNMDVLIFNYVSISFNHRGKGIGQYLHKARLHIARNAGASAVMCTVKGDNETGLHILEKFGWNTKQSFTPTFRRKDFGSCVYVCVKELTR
jgi:GNAT superfamily N-acetyltransferase